MEVEIISREILKPSLPTPHHLRTYKLSLFDQLAQPAYIPITLFYLATNENPGKSCDHLKQSLSKSLTHFYPFAGRLHDDRLTIDCNDEGVIFVEAQVVCAMSFVVDEPDNEVLQQLLPFNPLGQAQSSAAAAAADDDNRVMLGVQVNYFACGGIAIGVCISHIIADGLAAASFIKIWAQFACESDTDNNMIEVESVIYDCVSRFPPQDLSNFYSVLGPIDEKIYVKLPQEKVVAKRFRFEGSKIAALRDEIRDELSLYHPTRVEAVISLIWEALIVATSTTSGEINQPPIKVIANAMNLRARLNPQLPQKCIGNVSHLNMVSSLDLNLKDKRSLAKKIRESIKEIDNECKRKNMYMGSGEWINDLMKKVCDEFEKDSKMGAFYFISWCRFPFYGTDFGWGKPMWVEGGLKANRTAILVDSNDGEGIEAWITLSKEEMDKLEQQHGIIAYSTFKPSL